MINNEWLVANVDSISWFQKELIQVEGDLRELQLRREILVEQVKALEGVKVHNGIAYHEFDCNISASDRKIHRWGHYYEHVSEPGNWYVVIYGKGMPNGGKWLSDKPQPNEKLAHNLALTWVTTGKVS